MSRLILLNSAIMPAEGVYCLRRIDKDDVKINIDIAKADHQLVSYLNPRHEDLISFVEREFGLPKDIHQPAFWQPEDGDVAIVIKPLKPTRSGEELSNIEYEFYLVTYYEGWPQFNQED